MHDLKRCSAALPAVPSAKPAAPRPARQAPGADRRSVRLLDPALALTCWLLPVAASTAATLVMDNGDRLSGKVVRIEGGQLTFETEYAGTLIIDWGRVASLDEDATVAVLLNDATVEDGSIAGSPEGGLTVRNAQGESRQVAADEIAAVNPEPWRIGRGVKWTGLLNLAIKADRGTPDKDEIDFDLVTAWRRQYDRFEFRGDLEYDTTDGTESKNNWDLLGKYEYFVSDRLYYAANASAEYDRFKGINYRYRLGPAIGYQFYEGEDLNLKAETGLYYTTSDIDPNGRSSSLAAGWLIDADRRFAFADLQAYHWQSMVLSNRENMNFKSKTGVRVPLGGDFVGSAEVEANWDAETADDADSTEVVYRVKVGYGW